MSYLGASRGVLFLILIFGIFMLVTACTSPEGKVSDGARWYRMHNCYACHGEDGEGRRGGPSIAGLGMGYRAFVHRLRNTETAIMPLYSEKKISDQDAADILAFLKDLK